GKAVVAKALTETANKLKADAGKAKDNPALARAAARAQELVTQETAALQAAQKTATDAQNAVKPATDQMTAAQAALDATQKQVAEAPKQIKAMTKTAHAATQKLHADNATLHALNARDTDTHEHLEELTAA